MKKFNLAVATTLVLIGVPAAALVSVAPAPHTTAAQERAKKKAIPMRELAKEIAAAEAGMAELGKLRDAAKAPKSNVIVVGRGVKVADSPEDCLRRTITHFDLVAAYAGSLSQDRLAAAAKQGKEALEAGSWDGASKALAKMKALRAHKKAKTKK